MTFLIDVLHELTEVIEKENIRTINACNINIKFYKYINELKPIKTEIALIDPRINSITRNISLEYLNNDTILAIGAYPTINAAKLLCSSKKCRKLVLVPIPISNDSICTNRCNIDKYTPSIKCYKPDEIYIIEQKLKSIGIEHTLLSLGEIISAICSIKESITYGLIDNRKQANLANTILSYLIKIIDNAIKYIETNRINLAIRTMTIGLIIKCCTAILLGSHEHIARSDHSIAKIIEIKYNLPHGKALLHACNIISRTNRIYLSKKEKFIIKKIIKLLMLNSISVNNNSIKNLLTKAAQIRPDYRHPLIMDYLGKKWKNELLVIK